VRSEPQQFTQSKMLCAVALDRAAELARRDIIPDAHLKRWRTEGAAIRDYVETRCWSEQRQGYARAAGSDDLDASVLLALLHAYAEPGDMRMRLTVDAVRRELAHRPYVRRYTGEDGLPGREGAFVACSFWLAEALARIGRLDEASALMEQLIGLANDVGLYSEELDPASGAFLGNMPQGLSHLARISAALAIAEAEA
jgi:GH15 family glucan-1,4-alpha-glucosidase